MIKKNCVCLFIMAILNIGINCFGDIINVDDIDEPEICRMFESVEIDNGRIIMLDVWNDVEEVYANSCIDNKGKFYILSNDINIKDVSKDNINEKAERIKVWENERLNFDWRPQRQEHIYRIIRNESGLYETQHIKENIIYLENKNINKNRLSSNYIGIKNFVLSRILTTIIETTVLILISKICRKFWSLKNGKLLFTGILASTITLPLLWFMFPKFLGNYWVYVIFGEILVTIIETFIIKYSLKIERKMAIFASIVCNLCSFIIGLFIF